MKKIMVVFSSAVLCMLMFFGCDLFGPQDKTLTKLKMSSVSAETMEAGDTERRYVKLTPSSAEKSEISFYSENEAVATVKADDDSSGSYIWFTITAVNAGTTNIYAKSTTTDIESEKIPVTVTAAPYKKAGTYQVGTDIPAGEYLLIDTGAGYLEVTLTKYAGIGTPEFLYNDSFDGRKYVKVSEGQFLKFRGANLFLLADAPKLDKESDGGYPVSQFKVGVDIPAGEYLIYDTSMYSLNYIEITTEPYAKVSSPAFLFNELFTTRHYVKLETDQYLSFTKGKLYALADAPAIQKNSDGSLQPGQYKVGEDIVAGTHKIFVVSGKSVYYAISLTPLYDVMSSNLVENDNIIVDTDITLIEGQYIYFNGGKLGVSL